MNPSKQGVLQGYKVCAGKGCQNIGIHYLEVQFLHKYGWFCDSCKCTLVADNLVVIDASDGSRTRVKLREPVARESTADNLT